MFVESYRAKVYLKHVSKAHVNPNPAVRICWRLLGEGLFQCISGPPETRLIVFRYKRRCALSQFRLSIYKTDQWNNFPKSHSNWTNFCLFVLLFFFFVFFFFLFCFFVVGGGVFVCVYVCVCVPCLIKYEPEPTTRTRLKQLPVIKGGSWARQRCRVSCVIGASNWYWLTGGQGLLSLQRIKIEKEILFITFFFFTFIHLLLSLLSLSFIFYTISAVFLLHFSRRRPKMTHKGWRVVKLQHNQKTMIKVYER